MQTPLHYAAMIGNTELTEILISNKADINARDKEVLHICLEILRFTKLQGKQEFIQFKFS